MGNDLKASVLHLYKEHYLCNKKWCSYKRNPDKYRTTVSLTSLSLRQKLAEIVGEYTSGDNIEKIAPCASTKEVECFHSMLANKAPKAKHLCSSTSLECRVDCTVAQKNISYGYISQVYEECGISPGKINEKLSEKLAVKRKLKMITRIQQKINGENYVENRL
ncbi:unnamed protein product [Mytilus coruscus]|uniref:Uncharacterized protein n=1 Tax=Mytilus coruscus TaxID=42192 RepID=A0A6J8D5T9_MYTCO|nr:unnamed protein product [Mytilus coruscus]